MKDPFNQPPLEVHYREHEDPFAEILRKKGIPVDASSKVMLCTPGRMPAHVEDAKKLRTCVCCKEDVWISPSSVKTLAEHPDMLTVCGDCIGMEVVKKELGANLLQALIAQSDRAGTS